MCDIFLSHAVKDKKVFTDELASRLKEAGYKVWYSGKELLAGDSLPGAINKAISSCPVCIPVLSPHYFGSEWSKREVSAFLNLKGDVSRLVIPIWFGVGHEDVQREFALLLADMGIQGNLPMAAIVNKIQEKLSKWLPKPAVRSRIFLPKPGLNILLLPFDRLEVHLQREIKLEQVLLKKLLTFWEKKGLPAQVVYSPYHSSPSSPSAARKLGESLEADLVIWGDVYINSTSVTVELAYVVIHDRPGYFNHLPQAEMHVMDSLAHLSQGKLLKDLQFLISWIHAMNAYLHGKMNQALELFLQAGSSEVHAEMLREILFRKAVCYHNLQKEEEAIALYQRIIDDHPQFLDARLNLGNLLLLSRELEKAKNVYTALLKIHPSSLEAQNNLASLLWISGEKRQAVNAWNRLILSGVDHPIIQSNFEKAASFMPQDAAPKQDRLQLIHSNGQLQRRKNSQPLQTGDWFSMDEIFTNNGNLIEVFAWQNGNGQALYHPVRSGMDLRLQPVSYPFKIIQLRNQVAQTAAQFAEFLQEEAPFALLGHLHIGLHPQLFPQQPSIHWLIKIQTRDKTYYHQVERTASGLHLRAEDILCPPDTVHLRPEDILETSLLYYHEETHEIYFEQPISLIFIPLDDFKKSADLIRERSLLARSGTDIVSEVHKFVEFRWGTIDRESITQALIRDRILT